MPELPEVETVRRGIEALAVGRHISASKLVGSDQCAALAEMRSFMV